MDMNMIPPPSPIPTGKGSRSAANPTLSQHLTSKPVEIPKLSLPEHIQSSRSSLTDIDLRSLLNRQTKAVNEVLKSAVRSGVFRITGHGVSLDEVRSELMESWVTGKEEFVWRPLKEGAVEAAWEFVQRENWRSFSHKMEKIHNELEIIASELLQLLYKHSSDQLIPERIKRIELDLSIRTYNRNSFACGSPSISSGESYGTCKSYALKLLLPLEKCEFHLRLKQGTLTFGASPQTILVTIGKELEVLSNGKFKSAYGELIYEPSFSNERPSYSIELSSSVSTPSECKNTKAISIADQIMLMIAISILCKMYLFIFY